MQVAMSVIGAFYRHALILVDLPLLRLHHIGRGDPYLLAVEVFYFSFVPQQRLLKGNLLRRVEVIANSAESCVWALLNRKYQVATNHIRHLLALALHDNCISR